MRVSHPWARSCYCKCVSIRVFRARGYPLDLRLWRNRVSYLLSSEVLTFLLDRLNAASDLGRCPDLEFTVSNVHERRNRFEKYRKLFALGVCICLFDYRRNTGMIIVFRGIIAFCARSTTTRLPDKR